MDSFEVGYLSVKPKENVDRYLNLRRHQSQRYASWDHCFNYFQKAYEEDRLSGLSSGQELQNSCLHLGFYLASWGMYRGKAPLLKKSAFALAPVIEVIISSSSDLWCIDVENYDDQSLDRLIECSVKFRAALPGNSTDTLVTKAMLGVFGNIPAFDRFFRSGLGTHSFNKKSLMKIKTYFDHYREEIELLKIPTIDFLGAETEYRYTQAKLIDMIFFVAGGGMD